MATRVINLGTVGPATAPAVANLKPLNVARANHIHQMMISQDRPLASGRRIVFEAGLRGAADSLVPEVNPDSGAGNQYGDASTTYVYGRARLYVSQGHRLVVHAWYIPGGPAQQASPLDGEYIEHGRPGELRVQTTWDSRDSGATHTTDTSTTLDPSAVTWGANASGDGALFALMRKVTSSASPPTIFSDVTDMREVSMGRVTVDLTISLLGGARLVDVIVYEVPHVLALDDADADWPGHAYSSGWTPAGAYPYDYPIEGSTGDDRFSATHMVETAAATPKRTGPTLFSWSAGSEDDPILSVVSYANGTGDDAMVARTVDNTSAEGLIVTAATFAAAAPAASLRCGIYGRDYAQSGTEHILKQTGVIRVLCSVYAKPASTVELTVRFQTQAWSYVDLIHTATAGEVSAGYAWFEVVGWLDIGKVPEDDARLWITSWVASSSWDVRAVSVTHMPDI